ncbi:hypothetical protein DOY81_001047 [Sarcophaga bullata]|nr:hypothetical protein DOY81_001047 [Sarcophaga bullata]
MSKQYEICCTNCGHQFPYNSTNPETSAEGQAKEKAEGEVMETAKPLEINSTGKLQLNKYKNYEKECSNGNNESDDHTAIDSQGHQHTAAKEQQEISFNTGNLVTIWNFKPSAWNANSDTANVIDLAKRMGLLLSRDDIIDMDVYRENQNSFVYEVYFCSKDVKEAFLAKSYILKEFPETQSITIF